MAFATCGDVLAVANIDTGGSGPISAITGDGWRVQAVTGTLAAAYHPLPLNAIVTPPTWV